MTLFCAEAATHVGRVRSSNQDAHLVLEDPLVFAVADGMGGLSYGDVASRLTIDRLRAQAASLQDEAQLRTVLGALSEHIYKVGELLTPGSGIGTTLTLALPLKDTLLVAHIGDSQLYCVQGNALAQLTQDHTLLEKTLAEHPDTDPSELPQHYAHTLTRCLGQRPSPQFDFFVHPVHPGDRYLLCTDGIGKVLDSHELQDLIQAAPNPKALVDLLIVRALKHGGPDNATALAFFAPPEQH